MKIASALLTVLAASATSAPALCEGFSGAIGLASEQVLRGIGISNGEASVSVDANVRGDTGWAAGIGIATLGRDERGRRTLLTASLGRGWQLGDAWSAQLGAAHYAYPGGGQRHAFDYDELSASLGWRGRFGASVAMAPNSSRRDAAGGLKHGRTFAYELSWHQWLAGRLSVDAGLGWRDLRSLRGAGYPYGSVGLSWGAGPLQLVGSFITSRAEQRGLAAPGSAGDRWVASLVWDF